MDIICCYPGNGGLGEPAAHLKGYRSQVVVSSLPPCSLSLPRWGAEMGRSRRRAPVPSLSGEKGALGARCCQVDEDGDHLCSLKER